MNATTEESLGFGLGFGICLTGKEVHPSDTYAGIRPLSYEDATQWSTSKSVACSLAACII